MIEMLPLLQNIDPRIPQIVSFLLTYSLHSTLFLGAVWGITRLLRSDSPRLHDLLWKAALVGGLLTTVAQFSGAIVPFTGEHQLSSRLFNAPDTLTHRFIAEDTAERVQPGSAPDNPLPLQMPGEDIQTLFSQPGNTIIRNPARQSPVPAPRSATRTQTAYTLIDLASSPGDSAHITIQANSYMFIHSSSASSPHDAAAPLAPHTPAVDGSFDVTSPIAPRLAGEPPGTGKSAVDVFQEFPLSGRLSLPELLRQHRPMTWIDWVLMIWLAGVVLAAFRYVLIRRRLHHWLADRQIQSDGPLLIQLRDLMARAGINKAIRLSVSQRISSPVALSRREVCVPARAVTGLKTQQQQTMLAHEVAHIVRRDPLWLTLLAIFDILFFFQPMNRLARRKIQESAEFLCDDWALLHTRQHIHLARCLAEVAGWIQNTPQPAYVAGMGARGSALRRRVTRILDSRRRGDLEVRRRWPALLIIPLLFLIAWSAPGVSAVYSQPKMLVWFTRNNTAVAPQPASMQWFSHSYSSSQDSMVVQQIRGRSEDGAYQVETRFERRYRTSAYH